MAIPPRQYFRQRPDRRKARRAADWPGKAGRPRKLSGPRTTAAGQPVGAAICVHAKDMKEPWCIATSNAEASAPRIINLYDGRWTIEPGFRDTKDLRFGMGMGRGGRRVADPQRRDRLLLLNDSAIVLLTLLGAAGESLGMDRHLNVNRSIHSTHSLFRLSWMLYRLIPNMLKIRLRPLVERFSNYIPKFPAFTQTFSIV